MFVTRAHHEAVQRQLMQLVADAQDREQRAHDRVDRAMEYNRQLVQQIVEMRRTGFDKAPERPIMPERKVDPVQDAIALAAKNDAALRRHLGAWAKSARAEGQTDDAICSKILHWEEDAESV